MPFFVVPTVFAEKLKLAISFFNSSAPQNLKKLAIYFLDFSVLNSLQTLSPLLLLAPKSVCIANSSLFDDRYSGDASRITRKFRRPGSGLYF